MTTLRLDSLLLSPSSMSPASRWAEFGNASPDPGHATGKEADRMRFMTPLPSPTSFLESNNPLGQSRNRKHSDAASDTSSVTSSRRSRTMDFFNSPVTLAKPTFPSTSLSQSTSSLQTSSENHGTRLNRSVSVTSSAASARSLSPPSPRSSPARFVDRSERQEYSNDSLGSLGSPSKAYSNRQGSLGLGSSPTKSHQPDGSVPLNPPSRFPTILRPRPRHVSTSNRTPDHAPNRSASPSQISPTEPSPSQQVDDDLLPGNALGTEHRVIRLLGQGAFSKVILAEPTNGQKPVAIKLVDRKTCQKNDRMRTSVMREVEVLKHIHHPSLIHLLTSFNTVKYTCLVLEYAPGGELFDLLASHHADFTEPFVRRIFGELVDVLGWMHSIGLVHRDVKLENIILTAHPFNPVPASLPSPLIKLTDFGLSRFIDLNEPTLRTRCGSEEYAAPELIMGQAYDGRQTDAWALGVVLFALLTGALPFLANTEEQPVDMKARKSYLMKIARADYKWPAEEGKLVNRESKQVCERLLVRVPASRAKVDMLWEMEWMQGGSEDWHRKDSQDEADIWYKEEKRVSQLLHSEDAEVP